jgi:hypothetical protein
VRSCGSLSLYVCKFCEGYVHVNFITVATLG